MTRESKNPIRVLHLEDSLLDADLIKHRLTADGLVCEIVHADTQDRFSAELAAGPFDLILCDYNLPDYDGISALKLAREKHPATPVILISGSLGEEDAVKCLKHGGTDYLLKQRLERLPSAVERALQEAEQLRKRWQAEAQLRESEERFRQLAEHSTDAFWFVELNPERVLYVSPVMERVWGIPARSFYADPGVRTAAIHPDDQRRVREAWQACVEDRATRFEVEYRVVRADQSIRWIFDNGTPIRHDSGRIIRMSGVARDTTERRELERIMQRTQRLESIGTLAGGIAHDLNNMLAPIMMSAQLVQMDFPEKASHYLNVIQESAKRGAAMVKQLMTFAKGAQGERAPLQSRHLLKSMENLIRSTFPKKLDLVISCAEQLPAIHGDSTQLEQVLLNLCINARDAMPEGGTLTLKAECVEIDAVYASTAPDARLGQFVAWRIIDTGTGMPPEIMERIFEPFFSTKGPEKGTGLGLATVAGIVKGHGGFIRVYSAPNQGTSFSIYLPAAAQASSDTSRLIKAQTSFRGKGETVLLVDDDTNVRETTRNVLTALNFKVLIATNPADALFLVAQNQASLRIVITDLHMPGMDGLAFVRILRVRLPKTGIIVASGRLEEKDVEDFRNLGVNTLLEKPFTQERLVEALQSVARAGSN